MVNDAGSIWVSRLLEAKTWLLYKSLTIKAVAAISGGVVGLLMLGIKISGCAADAAWSAGADAALAAGCGAAKAWLLNKAAKVRLNSVFFITWVYQYSLA